MRDGAGHAYGHDHQMRLCCVPGGRDPILASRRASSAPARWCPRQSSTSCIADFPAGDRPRQSRLPVHAAGIVRRHGVPFQRLSRHASRRATPLFPIEIADSRARLPQNDGGKRTLALSARGACHSYRKAGPEHSNGAVSNNPVFLYGVTEGSNPCSSSGESTTDRCTHEARIATVAAGQ